MKDATYKAFKPRAHRVTPGNKHRPPNWIPEPQMQTNDLDAVLKKLRYKKLSLIETVALVDEIEGLRKRLAEANVLLEQDVETLEQADRALAIAEARNGI